MSNIRSIYSNILVNNCSSTFTSKMAVIMIVISNCLTCLSVVKTTYLNCMRVIMFKRNAIFVKIYIFLWPKYFYYFLKRLSTRPEFVVWGNSSKNNLCENVEIPATIFQVTTVFCYFISLFFCKFSNNSIEIVLDGQQ
jgi:hypothetical protein